jgi:hypothetical protein
MTARETTPATLAPRPERSFERQVECCQFGYHGFDPGIQLWGENSQLTAIAGKIELATRGRLKIDVSKTYTMDPAKFPVQIMIGPKP